MDEFVMWKKNPEEEDPLISVFNDKSMNLLYLYVGKTQNSFVVVAPKIKNLSVESEPSNFLKSFTSVNSGKFLFIKFTVNDDFINSMEDCGEEAVSIKVRFTTQFNEKITREYSAIIIK